MRTDKKLRNDIILIIALLCAAAAVWCIILLMRNTGGEVIVTVDGAVYGTYPLSVDNTVTIENGDNRNILIIKDGAASMAEASCPDRYCIKQGSISYDGEMIICLPNKVIAEVSGGEQSDVDMVAG